MKHCQAMSGELELHIEEKSMKQKHLGGLEKYKDRIDNSESLFFLYLNDKTEYSECQRRKRGIENTQKY